MSDPISQAEYSRLRGVSRAAVSLAIKHGRIRAGAIEQDGKIKILPDVADQEWSINTDPSRYRAGRPNVAGHGAEQAQRTDTLELGLQPTMTQAPTQLQPKAIDYNAARAQREWAESQLKMLELNQACGQLAPVEPMLRAVMAIHAEAASKLGDLPDLLAPQLAAESDPSVVWDILNREIEKIRDEMQRKCLKMAAGAEVTV